MSDSLEPLLTIDEVAERFRVSRRTLQTHVRQYPYYRLLGRRKLFSEADIQRLSETLTCYSPLQAQHSPSGSCTEPARPRLLTRREAAAYCRLSPQAFSAWIAKGRLPPAISGTNRWDIIAIDGAIDRLSGISDTPNVPALDLWKAKKNARAS